MTSKEIRKTFLDYFKERNHRVVDSSALIPAQDPTLLFTNAGMVQFKGVFLNEETREYKRAVTCQKCMRAGGKHNDLENVGHTARHHTFFEMLGNFSFGDYFKAEAIEYAWDLLTNVYKLPKERLWVTVFETDDEAERIWIEKTGIAKSRIVRMGEKDNFWAMGDTGPCGPCSEILIDRGIESGCGKATCAVGCDCDRYMEIWNLVFMQYNRDSSGNMTPLPKPCIDTGMGLERLCAVMQGKHSNYETDLFMPIIKRIEELSSVRFKANPKTDASICAIADHVRATTFMITDGILPGNEGRNYVLRRILRRAARHGWFLGLREPFLYGLTAKVVEEMTEAYPELKRSASLVERAMRGEEERFFETLERGLSMLDDEVKTLKGAKSSVLSGSIAFKLYDTYGFPVDLTADVLRSEDIKVDEAGFQKCMDEQRALAKKSWKGAVKGSAQEVFRTLAGEGLKTVFSGYHMEALSSRVICILKDNSSVDTAFKGDSIELITEETPFYAESGGQVGDTGSIVGKGFTIKVLDTQRPVEGLIVHRCIIEEGAVSIDDTAELLPDMERRLAIRGNHTATHILHALLRKHVGEHVRQAGSHVSPAALRFDFNHFEAVTYEQLRAIEDEANRVVIKNIAVSTDVIPYKEAVSRGALAFFGEKYGEVVRMVSVPGVSAELCGGTHAGRTGDIGLVRIIAESSVASGVRRIEAITGVGALEYAAQSEEVLRKSAQVLRVPKAEVPDKITKLLETQRELEKELDKLKGKSRSASVDSLVGEATTVKGVRLVAARVDVAEPKDLRDMADVLRQKLGSGVVFLAGGKDGQVALLAAVTQDLTSRISAGEMIKRIAPIVGGKGGGRADMAQAGGKDASKLDEAIGAVKKTVEEMAG